MKLKLFSLICIFLVGSLFLLNGCSTMTKSTNVHTSAIYAKFVVEHFADDTVKVWAQLLVGGPGGNKLRLTSEEHLYCNGNLMVKSLNEWHYYLFGAPEVNYLVRFARKGGENVDTTVTMAADLPGITTLSPNPVRHGLDNLTVAWGGTAGTNSVFVSVAGNDPNIIYTYSVPTPDDGSFIIDKSNILTYPGVSPGVYVLTVTVERIVSGTAAGTVNPAYQGGYIENRRYTKDVVDFQIN